MQNYQLFLGDCLESLRMLADNSVDSIVTDPPYGLTANKKGGSGAASVNLDNPYGRARIGTGNGPGGFMGQKWDSDVPPVEVWQECLRVLKPGGYLLAFAGTRTQHRMATRIDDAGFEIRDMIAWVYGSGFPKSRDIAALDMEGEDAERWAGWGTALKPALEPITVARKPLAGTVAENVLEHGTGALNIDGCRVPTQDNLNGGAYAEQGGRAVSQSLKTGSGMNQPGKTAGREYVQPSGRWPANLIHDGSEEVLACFPDAKGALAPVRGTEASSKTANTFGAFAGRAASDQRDGGGSAARFFYCAKASSADRHSGLENPGPQFTKGTLLSDVERAAADLKGNNHPTVKPTDLMRYLCRLVTPPGGIVLDPFMGSGSTGKAAMLEGFGFIGCELSPDYMAIALARIAEADAQAKREAKQAAEASAQGDLFAAA